MVDAVHSAIMKRGDMEEVPYTDSANTPSHVQLSDVSTAGRSKFLPALIATLVAAIGPLNFGYALGYSSPVELKLENKSVDPHLTKDEYSWFAVSALMLKSRPFSVLF